MSVCLYICVCMRVCAAALLCPLQIVALDKYWDLHDWLVWLDCDSLIMRSDVSIETVIWSALSAAERPDDTHLIISEDGVMVNTGECVCGWGGGGGRCRRVWCCIICVGGVYESV